MSTDAKTDFPIHELIKNRWSPYGYASRDVAPSDLLALFEAARWAPSCYNDQPWRFIVARKQRPEEFERLLLCLTEGNRLWAKHAPVLALGVAHTVFARNGKPNRHAYHDLGLAAANLCLEATSRGIAVHQMGGILPDRAREAYKIPAEYDAVTGIAIGYAGISKDLPENYQKNDQKRRGRIPQNAFTFEGLWGAPSEMLSGS